VVVAPRFTPPAVRSSAVGVVRMMMLIFRNAAEAEPRTKVWLDGATICRMGQEAVLVSVDAGKTSKSRDQAMDIIDLPLIHSLSIL